MAISRSQALKELEEAALHGQPEGKPVERRPDLAWDLDCKVWRDPGTGKEVSGPKPDFSEKISKHALLDRAKDAVEGRGLNYGKPENNFNRIARRWNTHLKNRYGVDVEIDAVDVAVMCLDLKLARLENDPSHLDSWIDAAGYAACGANIAADEPKS